MLRSYTFDWHEPLVYTFEFRAVKRRHAISQSSREISQIIVTSALLTLRSQIFRQDIKCFAIYCLAILSGGVCFNLEHYA